MREGQEPLREFARHNRSHMTKGEVRLWMELRRGALGHRFRRQHVIGRYIVDFVCLSKGLIVEVDGTQHYESAEDRERDDYLGRRGYRVLRFWSFDALDNTAQVVSEIKTALAGEVPIGESRDHGGDLFERST